MVHKNDRLTQELQDSIKTYMFDRSLSISDDI